MQHIALFVLDLFLYDSLKQPEIRKLSHYDHYSVEEPKKLEVLCTYIAELPAMRLHIASAHFPFPWCVDSCSTYSSSKEGGRESVKADFPSRTLPS